MTTFHIDHTTPSSRPKTFCAKCPFEPTRRKTVYEDTDGKQYCSIECVIHHREQKTKLKETADGPVQGTLPGL